MKPINHRRSPLRTRWSPPTVYVTRPLLSNFPSDDFSCSPGRTVVSALDYKPMLTRSSSVKCTRNGCEGRYVCSWSCFIRSIAQKFSRVGCQACNSVDENSVWRPEAVLQLFAASCRRQGGSTSWSAPASIARRSFEVCGQKVGCTWSGPRGELAKHDCCMKNPEEVYRLALTLGFTINRMANPPTAPPAVYVNSCYDDNFEASETTQSYGTALLTRSDSVQVES